MDDAGELYVLEVNAQCGLSEDENYTSIGAILRYSGKSFTDLTVEILDDARCATPTNYEGLRSPARLQHHWCRL